MPGPVTVPEPVPDVDTVSVRNELKLASTLLSASMVTVHGLAAPQPPPAKPAKVELDAGVAVRAMPVPSATVSEQSLWPAPPQSMPAPVTVPDPVPDVDTVSV